MEMELKRANTKKELDDLYRQSRDMVNVKELIKTDIDC